MHIDEKGKAILTDREQIEVLKGSLEFTSKQRGKDRGRIRILRQALLEALVESCACEDGQCQECLSLLMIELKEPYVTVEVSK